MTCDFPALEEDGYRDALQTMIHAIKDKNREECLDAAALIFCRLVQMIDAKEYAQLPLADLCAGVEYAALELRGAKVAKRRICMEYDVSYHRLNRVLSLLEPVLAKIREEGMQSDGGHQPAL